MSPLPIARDSLRNKLWSAATKYQEIIYKYKPLADDHIRVVCLRPSQDPEAAIEVELRPMPFASLGQGQEGKSNNVTALSYNWGDHEPSNPIFIVDDVCEPSSPVSTGTGPIGEEMVAESSVGRRHTKKKSMPDVVQLLQKTNFLNLDPPFR